MCEFPITEFRRRDLEGGVIELARKKATPGTEMERSLLSELFLENHVLTVGGNIVKQSRSRSLDTFQGPAAGLVPSPYTSQSTFLGHQQREV